jgi:hypothetical protein
MRPDLTLLLQIAGVLHVGLMFAGLLMPQVVGMRSHLVTLPPFIRQLFWVYYSFIALCLVSFSVITIAFADTLAAGSNLARALCAFFALFWTLRLIAGTFVFDMRPYLTSSSRRLGYHVLNIVFAYLPVVYILAATQPVAGQSAFPSRLDAYFTNVVKLNSAERTRLLAGSPVAKNLDADPAKEVAVFGAVWIGAPIAKYVAALQDIENFEKGGGFRITKRVSEPARVQDFAQLVLPDEDVRDLRSCRVGDCELKVSAEALGRLRKEVDWTRPDAKAQLERFVRTMAVEYVNGYREGGNARLAVYRDTGNATFVANEFRELMRGMPELAEYVPDMRRYLLDYPKAAARPTTSFIYWQEAEFGLKPTIRLNHVAIQEGKEATVVASKQLYSSHYFWTALEMRVLVPDPARGPGFWFVSVSRSRSDGLTGFVGRIIRGKVREGARSGLESALTATKTRLESR